MNAKIFNAFPKSFQNEVIARQERIEAVKSSLPQPSARRPKPSSSSSSRARSRSSARAARSSRTSSSRPRPKRISVESALASGTDFATLAKQQSTDTGSASRGGLVACTDSQQFTQLDGALPQRRDSPLRSAPCPRPVQTEFGFHVIKVAPWDFATARPVIEEAYAQQQGQDNPLTAFLNKELKGSKLWVDPRYGSVEPDRRRA